MTDVQSGKIFLAEQRGLEQTNGLRRFSTFNFGTYYSEYKQPIGKLYAFNDEWLYGLQSVKTVAEHDTCLVLVPITGALTYRGGEQNGKTNVGDIMVIFLAAQSTIEIANPYEGDWINYLQIHIKVRELKPKSSTQLFSFDLTASPDQLINVVNATVHELPFSISLGNFMGRRETLYKPEGTSLLFAFVLAGAFEMQGCLLHDRDGLALSNATEADLEALSNNALMLLVELPA